MLAISNVTGMGNRMQTGMGRNMPEDSVSEGIQKQIENAQKKLSDLSSNEEMSLEDKMKKRQEIQQEITNLNQQLRQHQIEMRKEKQMKGSSREDMTGGKKEGAAKNGNRGGMSQASMQAMISADVSMKQAQVQGSVATQLEGKAGILESEIKMDKARGANVEKKEQELAKIRQNAQKATASQMTALADANQAMEEAAGAEQGSKAEEQSSKADKADDKDKAAKKIEKAAEESVNSVAESAAHTPEISDMAVAAAENSQPMEHTSVDVRL